VSVGVLVGVGVAVLVGVGVAVSVAVGVLVGVSVAVLVDVGVIVGAGVGAVVDVGVTLHATKVSIKSATDNNTKTCLFIGLLPLVKRMSPSLSTGEQQVRQKFGCSSPP
jgi:hypothetical protein